jgi:hypothetical protein
LGGEPCATNKTKDRRNSKAQQEKRNRHRLFSHSPNRTFDTFPLAIMKLTLIAAPFLAALAAAEASAADLQATFNDMSALMQSTMSSQNSLEDTLPGASSCWKEVNIPIPGNPRIAGVCPAKSLKYVFVLGVIYSFG